MNENGSHNHHNNGINNKNETSVDDQINSILPKARIRAAVLSGVFVLLLLNAIIIDFFLYPLVWAPEPETPLPPEEKVSEPEKEEEKKDNDVSLNEIGEKHTEKPDSEVKTLKIKEKVKLIGVITDGEIKGQIREDEEKGVILEGEKKGELLDPEHDHAVFIVDDKTISTKLGETVHEEWKLMEITLDYAVLESPQDETLQIFFEN